MRYVELKNKQRKEYDDFSNREDVVMFAAFSNKQFDEAIEKYKIENYKIELVHIGMGMFLAKKNTEELRQLGEKWAVEMKEARKDENFAIDMFLYELANHEFGYSYDVEETLDALGLDVADFKQEKHLQKCLDIAINRYLKTFKG